MQAKQDILNTGLEPASSEFYQFGALPIKLHARMVDIDQFLLSVSFTMRILLH